MVLFNYSMACCDYNALVKWNLDSNCSVGGFSFNEKQLYFDFGY